MESYAWKLVRILDDEPVTREKAIRLVFEGSDGPGRFLEERSDYPGLPMFGVYVDLSVSRSDVWLTVSYS